MNNLIAEFKEVLITKELASPEAFVGCTEQEVKDLEIYFNLTLPALYKDFLKAAGRNCGKFLEGTDFLYEKLFYQRRAFESSLRNEAKPFHLNESMFVFPGHQGYIFQFFDTTGNLPDPPVYIYEEDDVSEVKLLFDKFSTFLLTD